MLNKYTVIKDTREKEGWDFTDEKNGVLMISKKLDTGDYTIQGYEGNLCIERKASASEVANNVGREKVRFNNEIDRMRDFAHAFIVCEFTFDQMYKYPEGSSLSAYKKKQVKIRGPFILKAFTEYQMDHNIQIIYAGNAENAKIVTQSIFKRFLNVR